MPYRRITEAGRLHALLGAVLQIESDLELEPMLRRIVEEAVELSDARYGALGVLRSGDRGLAQFIHVGMPADCVDRIGHLPEGRGILGLLIDQPRPIHLRDLSSHPESVGFPAQHPPMMSFLGVPIRVRGSVYGNLYLTEKAGGGDFTDLDLDVVETLAVAAGIAITNVRLHARVSELSVARDRDRIARDLHDTVIQRLYGIGLSLQGTIRILEDDDSKARIQQSLEELDTTIRQIRTSIFELEMPSLPGQGLRARVLTLTTDAATHLGFEPAVRFHGALDTLVSAPLGSEVLAVLREALANVSRHASAHHADVELSVEGQLLQVVVRDDGVGLHGVPASSGKGLANMSERARAMGGSCLVGDGAGGGAEVRWLVPMSAGG